MDEREHGQWASIRFPARERAEAAPQLAERVARITALQREDEERFDRDRSELLAPLDLSAGSLIVMTFDERFGVLFENWAASCDAVGVDVRHRTLVFPCDAAAHERAEALGFVAHFDEESPLLQELSASARYGDVAWTGFMYHQNWVIQQALKLGVDVLFQDADVVWRHDPIPVLAAQAAAGADVQAMYDGPNPRFQPLYANSGFLYFRPGERSRRLWDDLFSRHDMVGYYRSQQEPFNVVLAAHAHRGLQVQVLDEDRFANGHLYCGGRSAPADPWVVHHSWTVDMEEKLGRFEAAGHWHLGPGRLDELRSQPRPEPVRPESPKPGPPEAELLAAARRDRDRLAREVEALRSSASWRITAPLRAAKSALRRRA